MDTIKFGTLPTLYPITDKMGFSVVEGELYNPDTGGRVDDPTASEYNTSFLVPIEDFPLIRNPISDNLATFRDSGVVTRIPVVVDSLGNPDIMPGTYEVFWVSSTYERYNDKALVTLRGFGEPSTVTITPGQTFSVIEGAALGTIVGTVKGFKPGITLESRPDIPFAYDPPSGVLSVSGKVDFETAADWSLTIGGQEVTVWVLDAPENPIATQTTYTYYLDLETQPGTTVGTVTAEQQGDTGTLPVYTLVSGNTGGWAIDSLSGEITYIGGQPLVDGQVLGVGYGGTEPLTVTLRVLPSSVITLPILRFTLPPTLSDGQLVGDVGALGVQATLTHPGFGVVDNKLQVQDKSQIEAGLTELTLELIGEGRTGTQTVYVVVVDHAKVNEFWLAEDSTNGTEVGQVELPEGGSYTVSPTTLFNINSGTGDIIVTNASSLVPGSYPLTIQRGTSTASATVVVYAVLSSVGVEFTVAPSAPSGSVVGTLTGTAPFTANSAIAPYTLDSTTGVLTLSATPAVALTFGVTDGAGDVTEVAISLDTTTTTPEGFLGAIYPGQQGQAVATRAGILFSVGSIGWGQGSLNIKPDNLGSTTRNTEGKLVASKAAGLSLPVSGRANPAMVTALKALWALPLESPLTVSVVGADYVCWLVNLELTYDAEGVSVTLDLRTI